MSEILYKKVGRKYVPQSRVFDFEHAMPVGSFMLVYAYTDGGRQYEYAVTPDTASFVAAAMVAQKAMEQVIQDKSEYKPQGGTMFTKAQQKILAEYREKMREVSGNLPTWWNAGSSHEIVSAAIEAVRSYKP
jgi:hypothetical protein